MGFLDFLFFLINISMKIYFVKCCAYPNSKVMALISFLKYFKIYSYFLKLFLNYHFN